MKRAMYAVIVLWAVLTAVYMTNMGRADKVSISTAFTDSVDGEEWCELDTYIIFFPITMSCLLFRMEDGMP